MAFASVQRRGKGANAASISIGAGDGWATPTTGNLLVVTANSDALVSITGTWTAGPSVIDGNGTYLWHRISDGTESTITCTPSVSDTICIIAAEYSGNAASPFDVSNSSTIASSSGTTTTSVSVTTTAAGDLIIAAACLHSYGGGSGPNSPSWTNSFTNQVTATSGGATSADVTTFYAELIAGAAGSYSTSASWTNAASDRQQLTIAFKAAAASSATYPPAQPRSRRPVPVRVARSSEALPVRAQVNPPIPVRTIAQPRRIRGLLARRGRMVSPVPAQVVTAAPPFPFAELAQSRRLRGPLTRRGRVAAVPLVGAATPASPVLPLPLVRHALRLLPLVRRGRVAAPAAGEAAVPPARRHRTSAVGVRRRQAVAVVQQQPAPTGPARRDLADLPVVRRGRTVRPLGVQSPAVPPPWVPALTRIRQWRPFRRIGRVWGFLFPGADHVCTIERPDTGTIGRPSTGAIVRPSAGLTARPDTGTVDRPDTGIVPFEC